MKKFRKFIFVVIILEIVIIAITNFVYIQNSKKDETQISREENNGQIIYKINNNSNKDNFNIIFIT